MPLVKAEKTVQGCPPDNLICHSRDSVWTECTFGDGPGLVANYYFGALVVSVWGEIPADATQACYRIYVEDQQIGPQQALFPTYDVVREQLRLDGFTLESY